MIIEEEKIIKINGNVIPSNDIINFLKFLRNEKKITLSQLAKQYKINFEVPITPSLISKIESGKRRITLVVLKRFLILYNSSIEELFDYSNKNK